MATRSPSSKTPWKDGTVSTHRETGQSALLYGPCVYLTAR